MLKVNDIFYTLQGEGSFAGTPATFIRLSDCNLACKFCDTEFISGSIMTEAEIVKECLKYRGRFIVLTGGEPTMQNLNPLCCELKANGFYITMETNGMFDLSTDKIDWICLSPKSSFKRIKLTYCNDLKFVIKKGSRIPKVPEGFQFNAGFISPMNETSGEKIGSKGCTGLNDENLQYCIELAKNNPFWRLNVQIHKIIGVE